MLGLHTARLGSLAGQTIFLCGTLLVGCVGRARAGSADAGANAKSDVALDAISDVTADATKADAGGEAGACANLACGDYCNKCEWGACDADGAPHELQCNSAGRCQYISMTDTPPACMGPGTCGDGSCPAGYSCHCMFNPTKRCCPVGTKCGPCQ